MKLQILILSLFVLFLSSCDKKRTKITNSKYENFSNLNHIEYSDIGLFNNYENLPISITNGDFSDHNSILFLTESANVIPIERENLKSYSQKMNLMT